VQPAFVVADAPAVQMLLPGFTAQPVPLELTNLTSLKYRADGQCYAVGYNGKIWLLSDTDGDGAPDRAKLFWDGSGSLRGPIGLALTPPGYARGEGVLVPSKGKLSLIVDKNGDDIADEEIVVASGWKEIPQNVDAVGCALDREGNIYFALGVEAYNKAYLLDAAGQSQFRLTSERSTVLKVSPDFSRREIFCTGTRFPVALAFNRHGDLFGSEQEGATWMPNGNPFDELLHLQPGRHYGFPPRHPVHLPDVFDEPSTFDYGPQHQSACGLNFNEPVNGGPVFGPASWAGDALVTGESRGKIYRTQLVKTAAGYVAQNHLIACLNFLTVDACVTPRGDLLVACHTGKPDWGTGPNGPGKLFLLRYTDRTAPQPVATWSASPTEIRVAFDRPLDPAALRDLAKRSAVTAGKFVMPGDRFEAMRPPYQVVKDQLTAPRFDIAVQSGGLTPDRRTLILRTAPRTAELSYAVRLPNVSAPATAAAAPAKPGTYDDIELHVQNHGVAVTWSPANASATTATPSWTGWLPHPDLAVSRAFTAGSADHDRLWSLVATPGQLTLRTQLDVNSLLQPAVQPGAKLDYEPAREALTVRLPGAAPLALRPLATTFGTMVPDAWTPITATLATGPGAPADTAATWTRPAQPDVARPLPLHRFKLPWAAADTTPPTLAAERVIPEIAGGNWLRGRRLFHSEQVACARCHRVRGEGQHVGPDLSHLVQRDYASTLRDILEPSSAINPDYPAFTVELTDGAASLTGSIVGESATELRVADAAGNIRTVPRTSVRTTRAALRSLMPEGLLASLDATQVRDLMTFLLTSPLEPAPIEGKTAPPPPRARAEFDALLKNLSSSAVAPVSTNPAPAQPLHILLVDGPKDHGKGEHDYPQWRARWSKLLALADGVTVDTAHIWPTADQFARAHVICFFNNNPGWNEERGRELDAYLARGGGAAYFHWAVEARLAAPDFARRIGIASNSKPPNTATAPSTSCFTITRSPAVLLPRISRAPTSSTKPTGPSSAIPPMSSSSPAPRKTAPSARNSGRARSAKAASSSPCPATTTGPSTTPSSASSPSAASRGPPANPPTRLDELAPIGARLSDAP
jgi:putative heme-binding domain-containing protein